MGAGLGLGPYPFSFSFPSSPIQFNLLSINQAARWGHLMCYPLGMHSDYWSNQYVLCFFAIKSLVFTLFSSVVLATHSRLFPSVLLYFSAHLHKNFNIYFLVLSVHSTWRNCYGLILGGCSAKRTIHTEFYSGWYESTFKDNAICVIL